METKIDKILIQEFGMLNTSTSPDFFNGGRPTKKVVETLTKRIRVENMKRLGNNPMEMEFDLIGIDPSLANSLRRIMISDVPSMAIEKVFIYNNTSIIQDEVLAHRLGLIPLKADPRLFQTKTYEFSAEESGSKSEEELTNDAEGTSEDTIIYELKVRCKRTGQGGTGKSKADKDTTSGSGTSTILDEKIYSNSIKPIVRPGMPSETKDVGPIHDDILIAKMRPGHELDIKLYAIKGTGRDHAKFSPVATAFYRLLPDIIIKKPVVGEAAARLQSCFSPGVIGIDSDNEAYVKDTRYDGCSRNVFRHEDLKDCVELSKIRDHFIFNVESVGALLPEDIVTMALDVLEEKCQVFIDILEQK